MPEARNIAAPDGSSIVLLSRRVLILAAALTLSACGTERQQPPDVTTPGPPIGVDPVAYPAAGVAFLAPKGWLKEDGTDALVASFSTGEATIAIYRYARTEPLPRTKAQLDAALDALVGAAKARDATFTEIKRNRLKVDGHPAVQLRGTESVVGRPRTVRSTHVYAEGGEVVIDAYSPDRDFRRVDAQVFRGVLRSIKIGPPGQVPQ